jgi:hypothetical protein
MNQPAARAPRKNWTGPTTKVQAIKRNVEDKRRKIGFGAECPSLGAELVKGERKGVGDIVDYIKNSQACELFNAPTILEVRWTNGGAITDEATKRLFGSVIDIFNSGTGTAGVDYIETDMAQPGETQTNVIVRAVQVLLQYDPFVWDLRGNAFTTPAAGQPKPPSPTEWTVNDRVNGALGPQFAGASPEQVYKRAQLWWGEWAAYAFWHMVRGYNIRWTVGTHTNIFDFVLRNLAYLPSNAQPGSASNSEMPTMDFVRRCNDRYAGQLGSDLVFDPIDFIRVGSRGAGTQQSPNLGRFEINNDFTTVNPTYGGSGLRELLGGNDEFFELQIPYLIKQGVPIGLKLYENDTDQGDMMRRLISATNGFGGVVPPIITPGPGDTILDGPTLTGANVMLEDTLDVPPFSVPQQSDAGEALFKMGHWKITQAVKGDEVDDSWYTVMQGNQDLKNAILRHTGVQFAR